MGPGPREYPATVLAWQWARSHSVEEEEEMEGDE